MKLIIGLGNPGSRYETNRHNVGHLFVDFFLKKMEGETIDAKVFRSESFMNDSGKWVAEKVNFFKVSPEDLVLVHDDLDLRFGEFKIQLGVGPKIHYGVNSVEEALGTKNFWRVRIGVDARSTENRVDGEIYVLQNFTKDEQNLIDGVFEGVIEKLKAEKLL